MRTWTLTVGNRTVYWESGQVPFADSFEVGGWILILMDRDEIDTTPTSAPLECDDTDPEAMGVVALEAIRLADGNDAFRDGIHWQPISPLPDPEKDFVKGAIY
jgi:hypothetical protein